MKTTARRTRIYLIISALLFITSINPINGAAQSSRFDSITRIIDRIATAQGTKTHELVEELYDIAHHSADSLRLIPQCIYNESTWAYTQGVLDVELVDKAKDYLARIETEDYPFEKGLLNYSLSLNYIIDNNFSDAFSTALQALQLFEQLNDSLFMLKALNNMGFICSYVNLFDMSYGYYKRALALVENNSPEWYKVRSNVYRNYLISGELDRCIDSLKAFIVELEPLRDTSLLIISYINLASCYYNKSDYETAFRYCTVAQNLMQSIDNKRFQLSIYQHYASYYFNLGDYSKPYYYLKQSIKISKEYNILSYLATSYYNLSLVYEETGKRDSAYFALKEFQALSNNQGGDGAKAIASYHAYISAFLESSENKLVIAKQKIALKDRQIIAFSGAGLFVIVVVILLLVVAQQKKRLKETENKELSLELEHEKKIQELQEEKHRTDIDSKTREITSYSLQLSNKNNILQEILDLSNELSKKEKNVDEINKKISLIVKNNLNTDRDWEAFKQHFDKVHPRFFDKLKEINNELTENNLRLCAYFRIGMPPKQIAHILNISPESVSMNRHRLRKKLDLSEGDSLEDFLRNISG